MLFTPIELTDENVQKIFDECLVDEKNENRMIVLLYEESIYDKLYFDFDRIKAYKKNIAYMFGQLKGAHLHKQMPLIPDLAIKYNEKSWVKNKASLMKFICLGIAASQISKVSKKYGNTLNLSIKPTLSPSDPNFEAWWEEHRAEWED